MSTKPGASSALCNTLSAVVLWGCHSAQCLRGSWCLQIAQLDAPAGAGAASGASCAVLVLKLMASILRDSTSNKLSMVQMSGEPTSEHCLLHAC